MWMIKISHAPTLYFEVLLVLLGTFRHFKVFLGIWGTSSYFEVLLRTSEYCEVIWDSFKVLSPQSSIFSLQSSVLNPLFDMVFDAKNCLCCLKKLRLRHFCRKYRENLNIRVMRTKFWVKLSCEDAPQVVPGCLYIQKWKKILPRWTKNISLTKLVPPDQYSHIITIRAPVRAKNTNSNSNTNFCSWRSWREASSKQANPPIMDFNLTSYHYPHHSYNLCHRHLCVILFFAAAKMQRWIQNTCNPPLKQSQRKQSCRHIDIADRKVFVCPENW